MPETETRTAIAAKLVAQVRAHPVLAALLVLGAMGGAAAAVWLPIAPEGMSVLRRAAGGALAGLLFAMCALGFRLYDA